MGHHSGFHSVTGQISDRLFGSDLVRPVNLVDKNMPSIGSGNLNMGRKNFGNQYGNDPSVGLSISHTIADPSSSLNFGGIRKVKVNQVRDSDNCMSAPSIGHSYSRADDSTISIGAGYNKNDGNISLGPTYNNENDNTVAMGTGISKTGDNLVSVGHTFNKGDGNLFVDGPQLWGDGNFISMGQSYEKEDGNLISLGISYTKGQENFISMGPTYGKSGENFITVAPSYDKGTDHVTSMGPTYDKVDSNIASTVPSYDRGDSSPLPMGQNHNKGLSSTISFGGFHNDSEPNPSGGIISGYDMLMGNQNSAQGLDSQKDLTESNPEPLVNNITKPNAKNDTVKNKEPKTTKKAPSNNFPSNVKSLLSTGIFDGVQVKYVSWSREKSLKGTIKGTGYLCSCDDCKQSKPLNAYEFERHAGAKTKHPNNHIYFENGKTIYAVVQELKNTPQEMLFDAIQNVTGSNINQKNFRIWKASYQAATRELQRIYGKDEVVIPS
ncbi:Jas TPL-binding domain [Sesbania bispinosa]|nr:Jas TPL-binding domain [Sesbania bispinosa]